MHVPRKKQEPVKQQPVKQPLLAVVADVHLGNFRDFGGAMQQYGLNARGTLTLKTFSHAAQKAYGIGVPLAVAGDVFHHKRPEPAIIAQALDCLTGDELIIPGNHDTIDATAEGGNTACAPLGTKALVTEFEHTKLLKGGDAVLLVPFDARKPMREFLDEQLRVRDHLYDHRGELALVTHVGVVDDDSPPWLRDAADAIHANALFDLMDREGIVVAFVGNYHQHREWERGGRKIVQVGALNPTGFADEGLEGYGGFAVWYGGTDVRWESIPGPRFVRLRAEGSFLPSWPDGCSVFARADHGLEDHAGIVDRENALWPAFAGLEFMAPEPGVIETIDLKQPDKLLEGAEAALEEYVDKMLLLPLGLGKAEVLTKLKEFWRRAA